MTTPSAVIPKFSENGSTRQPTDTAMTWSESPGAVSYNVHFGKTASPALCAKLTNTTFDPGKLEHGTTYYWRIDATNRCGVTPGPTSSFRTASPPLPLTLSRRAALSGSIVAVIINPTSTSLDVSIDQSRPPDPTVLFHVAYTIPPNDSKEIGWVQGHGFYPGDRLRAHVDDYEDGYWDF